MRRSLIVVMAAPMLAAQAPALDVAAAMEALAAATTALERAITAEDRAGYAAPLESFGQQLRVLRGSASVTDNADARASLAALELALGDLKNPLGDGRASDPFDFARLRGACTSCHLATRSDNDARGLFPNRAGAVAGRIRLEQLDGVVRDDASGVVVFLEAVGLKAAPLPRAPAISQRDRRFHPATLAVTTGTTVRFPNDDVVFHNVFSLSRANTFDLGSYGKGLSKEQVLATPGLVRVHCNIHPDMAAHVLVLDTPFSAVSTAAGFWSIGDLPEGDYTLRVWHPLAAEQRQPITVACDKSHAVALTVRETKPRVQHTNKNGRAYPDKY